MIFVEVLEVLVAVLFIWFCIAQIFLPLSRGTPVCPLFRKEAELEKNLEKVRQEVVEKKIQEEIETIKQKEGVK